MVIVLNGENHQLPNGSTAADLVESLQLGEKRVAMEINLEIIPRSSYETRPLGDGDRIEIVHAIGGGTAADNREGK